MPADGPSDDELMHRLGEDDEESFVSLVRRHQAPLLNFFVRMGAHIDEAEDLAQETFLRLYGYRKKYRPDGRFLSFLYVLARHARADMLRKSKRSTEVGTEALEATADPARGQAAAVEAKMDVGAALSQLSEKLRMVVVLGVFQEMEYRHIAEVLDIPVGTVKSRMHLAMRQLKEALDVAAR
jgi:RNA polymerase sigma-70 factor (ECF subfamily)